MNLRRLLTTSIAGLGLAAVATVVTPAVASAVQVDSPGPLMNLTWNDDLGCGAQRAGDTREAFYGQTACGTFVSYEGVVYGPDYVPAGSSSHQATWTLVSQTPISGNGTAEAPFKVDTVVEVAGKFRVNQRDTYKVGDERWYTTVQVTNLGAAQPAIWIYRGGDCYQANSDLGYGNVDGTTPQCVSAGGRIQAAEPITPGNTYIEGSYSQAWFAIGSGGDLPNTVRDGDGDLHDNGVAIGWQVPLPAGDSVTVESAWFLSSPFVAFAPQRILDSRPAPDGVTVDHLFEGAGAGGSGANGAFGDGQTIELQVGGRAGVSTDAASAILNVAVTDTTGPGFLTLWPCGETRPNASSVNYVGAGITTSVAVYAKLNSSGKLCIYALRGTHVIVDVNGYQPESSNAFQTVTPARLLETRTNEPAGTIDGQFEGLGRRSAGTTTSFQVLGREGSDVPADASAVILSVAGVYTDGPGFITVWPCGQDRPNASNVNFRDTGAVVPNAVITQVGENGTVCIYNSTGMDVIADVTGFAPADADYQSITPARLMDTRLDGETIDGEDVGGGYVTDADAGTALRIAGRGGVASDAVAVSVNVTVVGAPDYGFLTVWPCGTQRPNSSNLNYGPGDTNANLAMAGLNSSGQLCFYSLRPVNLIVDVAGYFGA